MKKIEITLNKSLIGRSPNQVKNIRVLGLKKINQKVIQNDISLIRGIIRKVHHLVSVKEIVENNLKGE